MALGSRGFALNQAVAAPSTTRGPLAKVRLGVPGTACLQGPRQAGTSMLPATLEAPWGLRYPNFTNKSEQALCMSWVSPAQKTYPAIHQPSWAAHPWGRKGPQWGKLSQKPADMSCTPAAGEAAVVRQEVLRDLGMAVLQITVLITLLQGPGEAEHRLFFEGGSKHGGTERHEALQCYKSEKLGRK